MFRFSINSKTKLDKAAADLQTIFNESIKVTNIDFTINETLRSFQDQLKYYLEGKSKLDPRDPAALEKAKHLKNPAEAVDIFVYIPGRPDLAYDVKHLCFVAGVITSIANKLHQEGTISHKLKWGGNWDGDGMIMYDQIFQDLPHFEIYK